MKIFYTICLLMLAKFSYAATWHVGKHQNIKTIQQAINQCKNGDTVIVEAGNYFEKNLIVNKSIVLLGIDYPVQIVRAHV